MKKCFAIFKGIVLSMILIIGTMIFMLGKFKEPTIVSGWWIVNVFSGAFLVFGGVIFVCIMTYEAYECKSKEETK